MIIAHSNLGDILTAERAACNEYWVGIDTVGSQLTARVTAPGHNIAIGADRHRLSAVGADLNDCFAAQGATSRYIKWHSATSGATIA